MKYPERQNQRDRTLMRNEQGLKKVENGELLLNGFIEFLFGVMKKNWKQNYKCNLINVTCKYKL